MSKEAENIKVVVRCRPLSSKEKSNGQNSIFSIQDGNVCLRNPADPEDVHKYNFDIIFGLDSRQESVFEAVGAPILEKAFAGFNATIFAYGQTGSGKTFSMQGLAEPDELRGIIPRMNQSLFDQIAQKKAESETCLFLVTCSYFEIYNEIIFDLLDPDNRKKKGTGLKIKEHGVLGIYVHGLQEIVVDSPQKMQDLIDQGMASRTVASTNMNDTSSRSHSVFTIKVHQKDASDESKNVFAKINLVDLAGSERAERTGASGAVLKEGANINKSLSALGNVINALVEQAKGKKKVFVPYRNSKLTRVLQESLGGNSLTSMLAALSPAGCNFDETLGTLRYASRAKTIKVNAVKNEEASKISKLNEEIKALKERLASQATTAISGEAESRYKQQLAELDSALKSTWEDKAKLSEAHEKERRKLAKEQEVAQQQLAEERNRRWRLLAEKGDLLMSLEEVSEVIETLPTEGWMSTVHSMLNSEKEAREQETVVNVYKSALAADVESLSQRPAEDLYQDIGSIRQLQLRVASMEQEVKRINTVQDNLLKMSSDFAGSVRQFRQEWKQGMHMQLSQKYSAEKEEVVEDQGTAALIKEKEKQRQEDGTRALTMFARQTAQKHKQLAADASISNTFLRELSEFASKIKGKLEKEAGPEHILSKAASGLENDVVLPQDEVEKLQETQQTALSGLEKLLDDIKVTLQKQAVVRPTSAISGTDQLDHEVAEPELAPATSLLFSGNSQLNDSQVVASINQMIASVSGIQLNPQKKDMGQTWFVPPEKCDKKQFLQVDLGQEVQVKAVVTQGGEVLAPKAPSPLKPKSQATPSSTVQIGGKSVTDTNEDIAQTVEMMGEMISWEALLKTTAPKKLLKRPPVRFLFDVFNKLSSETGYLTDLVGTVKWDSLQGKKDKIEYMDKVILQVTNDLAVGETPAQGSDIVTGVETGNTNKFLQLLALAAAKSKQPAAEETKEDAHEMLSPVREGLQPITKEPRGSWVTKYKVLVSMDGESWSQAEGSPFRGNKDSSHLVRRELATLTTCRYVRFQPSRWEYCICMRVDVEGWTMETVAHYEAAKAAAAAMLKRSQSQESKSEEGGAVSLVDQLLALLSGMNQGIEAVLAGAQAHEKLEQLRVQLKKEKMQSLTNEKDKLEAQLEQATEERDTLQSQNSKLNEKVLGFEAEKLDLTNQLLRLQAEAEKLKAQNEDLNKSLEDLKNNRTKNDEMQEKLEQENKELVEEREEKILQIEVLTEERDNARVNEEELFQELSEKSEDLEQLQQSYVYMTDRCNNYQDTIADLEEKLDSYQSMLSSGTILQHKSATTIGSGNLSTNEQQEQEVPKNVDIGRPPIANSDGVIQIQPAKKNMEQKEEETDNSDYDDDFEDNEEDMSRNNGDDCRIAIGSPSTGRSKSRRPESAHRSGRHASFNNNVSM